MQVAFLYINIYIYVKMLYITYTYRERTEYITYLCKIKKNSKPNNT